VRHQWDVVNVEQSDFVALTPANPSSSLLNFERFS